VYGIGMIVIQARWLTVDQYRQRRLLTEVSLRHRQMRQLIIFALRTSHPRFAMLSDQLIFGQFEMFSCIRRISVFIRVFRATTVNPNHLGSSTAPNGEIGPGWRMRNQIPSIQPALCIGLRPTAPRHSGEPY
jgi:hypothetical protein